MIKCLLETRGSGIVLCSDDIQLSTAKCSSVFRDINECLEADRTAHGVTNFRCVNDPAFDPANFDVSDPLCTNLPGDYE
jgi:hypothetical protein